MLNGVVREFRTDDVWLMQGDALTIVPQLEPNSVQAVIVDPPYGIDYQSAWRIDKAKWKPKVANDERPFVWFLPGAFHAADVPSCLLCFCRWDVQQSFERAIEWAGFDVKQQVIWDRESHGMGDLNGSPAPQHDVIWFAVKGGYKFHGSRPKSVVRSLRLGGDELVHPNQKPTELMEELVTSYAPEGATVLDCFLGSGSTGKACVRTGRRFIGIELDETRYLQAEHGIKKELDRNALLEPPVKVTQKSLI